MGRAAGGGGGWEAGRPQIRKDHGPQGQRTNVLAVGSHRWQLCRNGEVILVAGTRIHNAVYAALGVAQVRG